MKRLHWLLLALLVSLLWLAYTVATFDLSCHIGMVV